MSLEQAIQENTAAVQELITLIKKEQAKAEAHLVGVVDMPVFNNKGAVPPEQPEAKKSTPAPAETAVSSPPVAEPVTEVIAQEQPLPVTLDMASDIVPAFLSLCKTKGAPVGRTVLSRWNVDKITKVPADQLSDLLADIQKAAA